MRKKEVPCRSSKSDYRTASVDYVSTIIVLFCYCGGGAVGENKTKHSFSVELFFLVWLCSLLFHSLETNFPFMGDR